MSCCSCWHIFIPLVSYPTQQDKLPESTAAIAIVARQGGVNCQKGVKSAQRERERHFNAHQLLYVNKNRIVFFLISVYLPFPTFVYVNQRKKRMAEHRSLLQIIYDIYMQCFPSMYLIQFESQLE